jgi:hypothetical protein
MANDRSWNRQSATIPPETALMLYSYIVRHDSGFAPFFGYCTLACCKPGIRKYAKKGDWIVGLTPRHRGIGNRIVFFMEVEESLSFDDYWRDPRFQQKRPKLNAGLTPSNSSRRSRHHGMGCKGSGFVRSREIAFIKTATACGV